MSHIFKHNHATVISLEIGSVYLIATGPSVSQIDYRRLRVASAIGVNGAIALAERYPVKFDYHCIIDTQFAQQHRTRFRRLYRTLV